MSALLALQTDQVVLLAGIGLVVFVFVNRLRRSFTTAPRRHLRPAQARPTSSSPARSRAEPIGSARLRSSMASQEHESWEVEMHDLARQLKAEIDTKAAALAALVRTADEARASLESAIDRAESLGLLEEESIGVIAGVSSAADSNPGHPVDVRPRRKQSLRLDNPADDPRFARVFALADAGFSTARIASQVGSQVGEVELILSLRRAG